MKQLIGADPIVLVRHIYLLVNNIRRECMLCVMYVMLDFNLVRPFHQTDCVISQMAMPVIAIFGSDGPYIKPITIIHQLQ